MEGTKSVEVLVFGSHDWRRLLRRQNCSTWKNHQARILTRAGYKVFTFASSALAYAAEVQGLQTVFYHPHLISI
jgi:hypothetical protein